MMDRDSITRTGARTPGVKRQWPLERWCTRAPRPSTQNEDTALQAARCTKGGCKPYVAKNSQTTGKAPSDTPAFQPYWGKPAVRMIGGRWKRRHHSKPDSRHRPTRPMAAGLVATCKDSSSEGKNRSRGEPHGIGTCARRSDDRRVTSPQEAGYVSLTKVTPTSGKGALGAWWSLRQARARLDKTGHTKP